MKRVVVIAVLAAAYFTSQHALPTPSREEDEVPDMSTICIVDTPAHVSSEVLTADQLAIVYASDGVRDKNGELVHISAMACPACGHAFPEPEKKKLELRDVDIMGLEGQEVEVSSWNWRIHTSRRAASSTGWTASFTGC